MFWGKIRNGLAQTKSKSGAYQSTARRRIAQKRPRVRPSPIRVAIHPPVPGQRVVRNLVAHSSRREEAPRLVRQLG